MRPFEPDDTKICREYLLDEDGTNRIKTATFICLTLSKYQTGMNRKLEHWRERWAAAVNTKFIGKWMDIDHRSYVRWQGLDLIPLVHEGANVPDGSKDPQIYSGN